MRVLLVIKFNKLFYYNFSFLKDAKIININQLILKCSHKSFGIRIDSLYYRNIFFIFFFIFHPFRFMWITLCFEQLRWFVLLSIESILQFSDMFIPLSFSLLIISSIVKPILSFILTLRLLPSAYYLFKLLDFSFACII